MTSEVISFSIDFPKPVSGQNYAVVQSTVNASQAFSNNQKPKKMNKDFFFKPCTNATMDIINFEFPKGMQESFVFKYWFSIFPSSSFF